MTDGRLTTTPTVTAAERRAAFRAGLESGKLLRFPGAFSPLVARAIADHGFDGVYVSGAALAADLALPDIGLTTLSEVTDRGGRIAQVTNLPTIIDADTGFGEPANVARTIALLEDAGLAGCHLEDQVNPKRCGHLDNKQVVGADEMIRRIRAAVLGRRDPNFIICARTDAKAIEGFDAAVERAKAYIDAGADMIFPEALNSEEEFAAFRAAVDAPLMANMTEFGQSPQLDTTTLANLGFNLVIWPVSSLRSAMGAVDELLSTLTTAGSQVPVIDRMQHRSRLYELVDYAAYQAFDGNLVNFDIPGGTHGS